jgi:4-hydroxythreonine-4-phosphate dehydrogenase
MNSFIPRIVITPGEPAGIGPDIILQAVQRDFTAELIIIADPELLMDRAKQLRTPIQLAFCDLNEAATQHVPGTLKMIPTSLAAACLPGKINSANSTYVMDCLALATDLCLQNKAQALVTGPIHKAAINAAGIPFTGHTEFLAERCRTNNVLMLFVVNQLKVALATTHIPLQKVSSTITIPYLIKTIELLHNELKKQFGIKNPRLFIAGLNPHAGEEGLLGREEIDEIIPALNELKSNHIDVSGPFPADTLFTEKYLTQCDAILGMYHDQVLPVVKHIGFSHAVNVTLGLPIIRTSVDHGTALDIAGTGEADERSLVEAILLAICLAKGDAT